jgi:hypothetical protein
MVQITAQVGDSVLLQRTLKNSWKTILVTSIHIIDADNLAGAEYTPGYQNTGFFMKKYAP